MIKKKIEKIIKRAFKSFGLRIRHYKEPSYIKIIKKIGTTVVFDIGANEGEFALSLREHDYKGKIVSFEPVKAAHERLFINSSSDSSWSVHSRVALGSEIGTTTINIAGNNAVSSSILEMGSAHKESSPESIYVGKENVPIVTIDSIFEKYVKDNDVVFLKIDVQGYEDFVLIGAKSSIKNIAAIKLELSLISLYEGDKLYDFYFSKLETLGFDIYDLEPGHRHPNGRLLQFDAIHVKKVDKY
jgi:FkbM family methyltransferase